MRPSITQPKKFVLAKRKKHKRLVATAQRINRIRKTQLNSVKSHACVAFVTFHSEHALMLAQQQYVVRHPICFDSIQSNWSWFDNVT